MKALLILSTLFLASCGTIDSYKNSDQTSYTVLTHARGGGLVGAFTGKVETCKISQHRETGLQYRLSLKDGKCTIEAAK